MAKAWHILTMIIMAKLEHGTIGKAKKFEISSIQFPIWTIARLSQLFTQTVHFPLNSKTLLSTVLNIRWDEILRISVAQKNINFLGSFHMIWFNPDIRNTCWEDVAETDSFTFKISKPLVPRLSLEWRTEVVCPHVKSPPSELARDVKQPCLGQSPKQLTKVFFPKCIRLTHLLSFAGLLEIRLTKRVDPTAPLPPSFVHGQPYQNLPSKETQDNLVLNPLFFLQLCSGLATDILLLLSALCTLHTAEQNFTTCEKQNSSNKLARPVQHLSNVSVFLRESIESITHITILAGNISTQNTRNI